MNSSCRVETWLLAVLTVFCYSLALAASFVLWRSLFLLATSAAEPYLVVVNQ